MVYDDLPMKHGGFFDGKTLNDQSHWIGLRALNFNGKKHDFRVQFYQQNQSNDQRVASAQNFQGTFGASAADETSAMAPLLKLGLT